MQCATVLYPNTPGAHFDYNYYTQKHIPMALGLIGKGIAKTEVRKGVGSPDGSAPTYLCIATIYIGDAAEYQAKFAVHGAQIIADIPNFTDVTPIIQSDEVIL
jgi:uncharacterized protein (TIGR02118 family)